MTRDTTQLAAGCDYTSAIAMRIVASTRDSVSDVAKRLCDDLNAHCSILSRCASDERGRLRISVRDDWLVQRALRAVQRNGSMLDAERVRAPRRVLVDHASPNMAKELHIGHLRSAIIGAAIANTLEFLGHSVERVSHVGDFGTPVAIVVAHAHLSRARWLLVDDDVDATATPPNVAQLTTLYVEGRARMNDMKFATHVKNVVRVMQKLPVALDDQARQEILVRLFF